MKKNYQILKFHVFIHGFEALDLCRDAADKYRLIDILVDTIVENQARLYAYKILDTHYHYLVGIRWDGRELPNENFVDEKVKSLIKLVNRRFGNYYRTRYNYKGRIFKKAANYYKRALNDADFKTFFRYIHLNAVKHSISDVAEDDLFNSYNLYLVKYLRNSEIQSLSVVQTIISDPRFIKVLANLDFKYSISMFSDNEKNGVKFMLRHHYNRLLFHNQNAPEKLSELGILDLYTDTSSLNIERSDPHRVTNFIKRLPYREISNENLHEYVQAFTAFFADENGEEPKDLIARIRKHYNHEFRGFVQALRRKIKLLKLSKEIGISRDAIRILTQKFHP